MAAAGTGARAAPVGAAAELAQPRAPRARVVGGMAAVAALVAPPAA